MFFIQNWNIMYSEDYTTETPAIGYFCLWRFSWQAVKYLLDSCQYLLSSIAFVIEQEIWLYSKKHSLWY
jgi:hypothetical protein